MEKNKKLNITTETENDFINKKMKKLKEKDAEKAIQKEKEEKAAAIRKEKEEMEDKRYKEILIDLEEDMTPYFKAWGFKKENFKKLTVATIEFFEKNIKEFKTLGNFLTWLPHKKYAKNELKGPKTLRVEKFLKESLKNEKRNRKN